MEDPLEEGVATLLQYSCLENPMDRGARWATVHGVTESDTTEVTQHACSTVVGAWKEAVPTLMELTSDPGRQPASKHILSDSDACSGEVGREQWIGLGGVVGKASGKRGYFSRGLDEVRT